MSQSDQWQWDPARNEYYKYSQQENVYVYQSGRRISYPDQQGETSAQSTQGQPVTTGPGGVLYVHPSDDDAYAAPFLTSQLISQFNGKPEYSHNSTEYKSVDESGRGGYRGWYWVDFPFHTLYCDSYAVLPQS